MSNVPKAVSQVVSEVSGAVIEPVVGELGKAIEEGVQAIVGTQPYSSDPAQKVQKQLDEQKRKQWALGVIERNRQLDEQLKKIRQEKQQQIVVGAHQESKREQVKQFKITQKKNPNNIALQRSQAERKVGKGLGG